MNKIWKNSNTPNGKMSTEAGRFQVGFLGMGLTYLILSAAQQLLVNKLFLTAMVTIILSALFAYMHKNDTKLMAGLAGVGACNIIGLFLNRYTVLEILGLISFATGIILIITGLRIYGKKKSKVKMVIACVGSLILFAMAAFLNFTAVFPTKVMVMMGSSVQPVENVWSAQQEETVMEDGTTLLSNVQYDDAAPNGFLDIYYTTKSENAPTLIFIHGGGYLWGDKASGDPNAENSSFDISTGGRFLAEGYNVVQMNYVLAIEKDYRFPAAIKQLNRGLGYLVEHADELNLDMTRVVIGGGSAGGNLAGTLINIQTNPEYASLVGENAMIDKQYILAGVFEGGLFDNSRFGNTGSAMVDWSFLQLGRAYLGINELATNKEVVTPTNVLDYVTKDFVPSFLSDGNTGTFNEQAEDMAALLDSYGVPNELSFFDKSEAVLAHGFEESGSEYADQAFERMFAFLDQYVK